MSVTARSGLAAVAAMVGSALRRAGITAVLTGGACACVYTRGAFQSVDMDFILVGGTTRARLDAAMAAVGFARRGDRYVHPRTRFYVEFPRGPLAVGGDWALRPVERRTRYGRLLMLSATDSCRDRLAAFYHWNDRQSLGVAVAIALRNRVDLEALQGWSLAERRQEGFAEFVAELGRARRRRQGRPRGTEKGLSGRGRRASPRRA